MTELSFAEYARLGAVNWSALKHLRESPMKYRYELEAPRHETTPMALGRATHCLVFEPQLFEREFAIYEGGDRRGKEWIAFKEAHAGLTILKPNEIETSAAMANAVRVHPLVAPYLEGGKFEQSVTWNDPASGLPCKARMDWINRDKGSLVDLKTTNSIDAYRFGRLAARMGYHCQMAHYYDGVQHGLGWEPSEALIVAVESEAPYDVAVFVLDEDTLYAGHEEVQGLLQRLKEYREADIWPGRYTSKTPLLLPAYVFGGDEDETPEGSGITFNAGE